VPDSKPVDDENVKPTVISAVEPMQPASEKISAPAIEPIIEIRKEEIVLPEEPVIKMTRKQLYDEIWEISVAGVAKKYDIPYSQLIKQIKEAAIPIPPSGYWTKLSFGKPVTKTELTESADATISIFKATSSVRAKKTKDEPEIIESAKEETTTHLEEQPIVLSDIPNPKEIVSSPITVAVIDPTPKDNTVSPVLMVNEPETIKRYGQTYNVYNRETLYKEVWEAPVTEVAKRYKVSDVAIHKVCKSLNIPTPPAGYWAKLRTGKPVTTIPLPKSDKTTQKTGIRTGMTYQPEPEKETLEFIGEEDRSVILAVASQILLPDEDARMYPKIIAHRKVVMEWKKQQKNNDNRGWNRRSSEPAPFLADSISDETLPRACRIIDALIKEIEPLGCSLTNNLGFVVNGETVQISFSESKDEVKHIPTKEENIQLLKYEEERKWHSWASKPQIRKYDHVFNGRLSLIVNSQKSYRDCKSYVLEDRLGDIMIELYVAAETLKKAREAREEAERKRQEEERLKEERRKRFNVEVDRTLALTNLADDYDTACKIRNYIAIVEASNSLSPETKEWIEWAKAKADWYDPTVAKEDDLFGNREHEKDAEKKKLQHKGYWW